MRTKGFKYGLISPGELRGKISEKRFFTIKSENHELTLKEMTRTINPENNNKRQILDNFRSLPYGYRPSHSALGHKPSHEHDRIISYIIRSFREEEMIFEDRVDLEDAELYRKMDIPLFYNDNESKLRKDLERILDPVRRTRSLEKLIKDREIILGFSLL
jgi:hypothetical protein